MGVYCAKCSFAPWLSGFLLNAYRFGELTEVYPIARGASPLIIGVFTILMMPETLSLQELSGVLIIAVAIIGYGFTRYFREKADFLGILLALITGCFIAAYSIVDAFGARVAQTAIGYYGASTVLNAIFLAIYLSIFHPGIVESCYVDARQAFIFGGTASYLAYVTVLWACLHTPVAIVSSLRETSILFAFGFGVFFLKERISLLKIMVTSLIFLGVFLFKMN